VVQVQIWTVHWKLDTANSFEEPHTKCNVVVACRAPAHYHAPRSVSVTGVWYCHVRHDVVGRPLVLLVGYVHFGLLLSNTLMKVGIR